MIETEFSILVIDDEDIIRETFQEVLQDAGYLVRVAENSSEALNILRQEHFDILLVDYNLPDMNGVDFIKEASEIGNATKAPYIHKRSGFAEVQ